MAIKFNKETLDAEMVLGDTGTFSFYLKNKKTQSSFLDEGDEVWFTLKKIKDKSIIMKKQITELPDDKVTVEILPKETENMEAGNYIYDLKLIRKDGNVDTLLPNGKPSAYFSLKRGVK